MKRRTVLTRMISVTCGWGVVNKLAYACSFGAYAQYELPRKLLPAMQEGKIQDYVKKCYKGKSIVFDDKIYVTPVQIDRLRIDDFVLRTSVTAHPPGDEVCTRLDIIIELDSPRLCYHLASYAFFPGAIPGITHSYTTYGYKHRAYGILHIEDKHDATASKIVVSRIYVNDWVTPYCAFIKVI